MQFNDKIAMIVTVCNDFSPNTIIQTANQTYKNMDVWILSDSTNTNLVKQMKNFCIKHKFYFLQHDLNHKQQHPTKIGNLFYFVRKYGKKYDYIFENDSSSIVSNNFVYNGLCFLHSPLLNHEKDACVVCNATFYGINNFHSYLYQQCVSLNTSGILNNHINTNKCLTGYAMIPYGYCSLIKTSVLQKIPINKVESTSCDTLRGYWLLLNNYKIYFNPFDFGGKIAPQSIWDTKNQRSKWIIADIFAYKKSKFTALKTKYHNPKTNYLVKATSLNFLLTPIIFIFYFIKFVFWFLFFAKNKNQVKYWFNFTSFILTTILIITLSLFVIIISLCKYKKQTFAYLLIMICSAIIEISLSLKRFFVIITHFFLNNFDWKKIYVITTKKKITFAWSKIIKQILLDTIIILILIAICLIIQFSYINNSEKNIVINLTLNLWLGLFMPLFLSSIGYVILNLIGNFKTKIGYDFNVNEYKFWHYDFRYKYVRKSTIWKQQNPNDF